MHHRALIRCRGYVFNRLLALTTALTLLAPTLAGAIPSRDLEPPCNSQGACYHAVSHKPRQPLPEQAQTPEQAVDEPELQASAPEVFGEVPFPDLATAIEQTGAATEQAGVLSGLATGAYNELFDYTGQSSQPEERIARLEPELLAAASQVDEYAWVRAIPVPEPATLALLGLGLLGMFLIRRGRSKG